MHTKDKLIQHIEQHIHELSIQIGARPTGSTANRKATDYLTRVFTENGFNVSLQELHCLDWDQGTAALHIADTDDVVSLTPSPYSLPCDVQATVEVVETIAQLENANLEHKIALLRGELTQEPLMPKNFRWYNPEHHQQIITMLETECPTAILTVSMDQAHPIPVFDDGDFDIPSAVILAHDAEVIVSKNLPIRLAITSQRKPSTSANVIARKNEAASNKFVVTAHFDTKPGTPGALDNASGVAVLLGLSELFQDSIPENIGIELVAFNGEDYFSTPGQIAYFDTYNQDFGQIKLAINCDGVGLNDSKNGIFSMGLPETYVAQIQALVDGFDRVETLDPWYQGDHMLFASAQVPTIALTSTGIFELVNTVMHTADDTPDLIDPTLIYENCILIHEIVNL